MTTTLVKLLEDTTIREIRALLPVFLLTQSYAIVALTVLKVKVLSVLRVSTVASRVLVRPVDNVTLVTIALSRRRLQCLSTVN